MPGTSRKFAYSEKLPSPQSGYRHRETPDLWSAPVQGITISESSQLSSDSQLRHCHPISLLRLQIVLAQSRDRANILHNLKIGTQFPDSENAQRNLKIAQIPRMCGTNLCSTLHSSLPCTNRSITILETALERLYTSMPTTLIHTHEQFDEK